VKSYLFFIDKENESIRLNRRCRKAKMNTCVLLNNNFNGRDVSSESNQLTCVHIMKNKERDSERERERERERT